MDYATGIEHERDRIVQIIKYRQKISSSSVLVKILDILLEEILRTPVSTAKGI